MNSTPHSRRTTIYGIDDPTAVREADLLRAAFILGTISARKHLYGKPAD